jgi:hypothetical protein
MKEPRGCCLTGTPLSRMDEIDTAVLVLNAMGEVQMVSIVRCPTCYIRGDHVKRSGAQMCVLLNKPANMVKHFPVAGLYPNKHMAAHCAIHMALR